MTPFQCSQLDRSLFLCHLVQLHLTSLIDSYPEFTSLLAVFIFISIPHKKALESSPKLSKCTRYFWLLFYFPLLILTLRMEFVLRSLTVFNRLCELIILYYNWIVWIINTLFSLESSTIFQWPQNFQRYREGSEKERSFRFYNLRLISKWMGLIISAFTLSVMAS